MINRSKLIILSAITSVVLGVSAFTNAPATLQADGPKNLKVLPKNISHEDLGAVMKGFNAALGVKCNHCHAPKTNGEKGLDFASDANHQKDIARAMMKMTKKINAKYFKHEHEGLIQNITCETCHNGNKEPKTIAVKP